MSLSEHTYNPFTEVPSNLSYNDTDFIQDVLGAEAAEAFRVLQQNPTTEIQGSTDNSFGLTNEEMKVVEQGQEIQRVFGKLARCEFDPETLQATSLYHLYAAFTDLDKATILPQLSVQELGILADHFPRLVDICRDRDFALSGRAAAPLLSALVFRVGEKLTREERENLLLSIDLSQLDENEVRGGFGIGWSYGTLRLFGEAGLQVGHQMTGGLIEVESCGDEAGLEMWGGELRIITAGTGLGSYASGGVIRAEQAGYAAGFRIHGATLILGSAGDHLGSGARRGYISVRKAGRDIGSDLGANSQATIQLLTKQFEGVSKNRQGGRILRPDGTQVRIGRER